MEERTLKLAQESHLYAYFMFNLLSNLFCSFLYFYFRSMKKEQNKFDNKLNIKDAWWLAKEYII